MDATDIYRTSRVRANTPQVSPQSGSRKNTAQLIQWSHSYSDTQTKDSIKKIVEKSPWWDSKIINRILTN